MGRRPGKSEEILARWIGFRDKEYEKIPNVRFTLVEKRAARASLNECVVGRSTASHGGPESKPAGFGGLSKEARTQEHSRLAGDSTAWRRSRPKLHTCLYRSLFRSGPKPIHPSTHPVCTLGGANCYESHGIGLFRVNGCNGLDATIDRGAGINLRGLGRQPVEDAPSGASSANTFIRRQCILNLIWRENNWGNSLFFR